MALVGLDLLRMFRIGIWICYAKKIRVFQESQIGYLAWFCLVRRELI